jgi:DNA-binding transcriptional LysR family regulator
MKSAFRNWSDVRVFLAVMRAGSTLAASQKLGMAQPTVARRIDALEHEIGMLLFDRNTRGSRPTEAARNLMPEAEALEAAAERLMAKVGDLTQVVRPIRITAVSANLASRVAEIFSEFCARHPEVRLEFLPGVKALDLATGEADVALRISWSKQHPDLVCRRISTARFTLYGAPSYAKRHGLPLTPADMSRHTLFSFQREDVPPIFHEWLLKFVPPSAIERSFREIALLEAAIRAGQGLGIMNLRTAETDEKAGMLLRCFEPPEELDAAHMVLVSPQAYRRREVQAFTKFFTPRYAAIFR